MAGRAAVGLDIGTSSVRAAELSLGRGPVTLERFGQVALPPGAVRGGEVADEAQVAAAIKQLWGQAKFSSRRVVVGVANQKVIVRQVDLPWLPLSELRASLPLQAQDFIPMPVEQAILDFHPLEEFTNDGGGRMLRVLLAAAARDTVSATIAAVTRAGLTPVMVDLTSFAVLRSLAGLDEPALASIEAEALVDVGASVTNIVVHQAGIPRFVRILLMGGHDVTEAVAERVGVPLEQAESVKQQLGVPAAPAVSAYAAPPGPPKTQPHPAQRVIETTTNAFVEEVRGSLDYYLASPTAAPLRRIRLSGGGGLLSGLADRLSAATRLLVDQANPLASMRVGRTGLSTEQLGYVGPLVTVPVGLAMGVAA
ncbi:MAG TPA: type IV pilus assembly protein PilM [Mycobacteriales bacterium]|nr:type IV pilus assembly protein PilM [Mycobacteriales bacterium]